MEFTMETTRLFLVVFIIVSVAVAIVLLLLSGIAHMPLPPQSVAQS